MASSPGTCVSGSFRLDTPDTSVSTGKTGPRLLQDLLTYDPRHEERAGRNLLTTAPPLFDPDQNATAAVPFRNCRHQFMAKHEQSVLPNPSEDPGHDTIYKIASFCHKCRWHLDLMVDFRDNGPKNSPCRPTSQDFPIHHFIYEQEDTSQRDPFGNQNVPRSYRFHCSAPKCPVEVRIRLLPPRFDDEQLNRLTNRTQLRRRWEAARQIGGDRADAHPARSVDALDFLCTYLQDSLAPKQGKARIPLLNRKFLKTFGKDCDDILKSLGFKHAVENDNDEGLQAEVWHLPQPPPAGNPLDKDNQRTLIEDARYELTSLILKVPESERIGARNTINTPQPSSTDIQRALGCLDYDKKPMSRSDARSMDYEEDHPYYAALGTVGDFSDALLLFAYARQAAVDMANSTYYFEALQNIAIGRASPILGEQVQILASQGMVNRKEVENAYRWFGLDEKHTSILSDDFIIGQFRARLADISAAQVEKAREMLRIIGNARQSEKITSEASNAIETYEQALSWLDLDHSQPDEFVVTMFTFKTSDNPASREIATKAVQLVAEHRKSEKLKNFLEHGVMEGDADMDVGEAYALLDIHDRANALDLDVLQTQLQERISNNPQNEVKYNKAYQIVCKDQQTNHKTQADHSVGPPRKKYPLDTWPVGCQNIGNTCYLNSVLQFLFTIKPLRDLVLERDDQLQELTEETVEKKADGKDNVVAGKIVGRMPVTTEKVEKAQQFVLELRKLFQLMITAPAESVRPETKLAALALAKNDTVAAPPSEVGNLTSLGEIGGLPVAGPMLPPGAAVDSVVGDDDIAKKSDTSSTVAEMDVDEDRMDVAETTNGQPTADSKPEPPSRPPPVPPRPQPAAQATSMKALESVAQQQDAAEILNNVFDLLSCAMKGEGTMRDGEQLDMIKKLFFSDITMVRNINGKTTRNTALQDNHLISPGNRNRPLYAALDDEFSLSVLQDLVPQEGQPKPTKYEYIDEASPIQIINVRRLMMGGGKVTKDASHIGLDEILYLDRYLKKTDSMSEEELQERREKQWTLQEELRALEARKAELTLDARKAELSDTDLKLTLADAVESAANFVESLQKTNEETLIDLEGDATPNYPDLPDQLRYKSAGLEREARALDEDMKQLDQEINSIFTDLKAHPYRLHAVFMHRGSASGGHYWIYIYDFQNSIWRKYNDDRVDEVEDIKDIFEQEERSPATSTGIVYIRQDLVNELTEAVRRNPVQAEMGEVEMKDVDSAEYESIEIINGIEEGSGLGV
ncbi:hypothetical protein BCR34DRAFT_483325 [Clohesyomyces aquaticus]|uniref:ubiquitinyl hydrolase 1 n=1 Tax=Clohesyomyces aquaticus TaxID=1231657 RepID=A0A1Y1ZP49_9PLEO|nr:hypothetical protein BCR34DRAFT_483325 [Clohesyomyces aquaticus]